MSASGAVRPYLLCLVVFAEFEQVIAYQCGIENQDALWAFAYLESMQPRFMHSRNSAQVHSGACCVAQGWGGENCAGLRRKEL
jgi:hypothetical protein